MRQERWDAKVDPPCTPAPPRCKTPWPNCGHWHCSAARPRSAVGQTSLCANTINAPNSNLICQASLTSSILSIAFINSSAHAHAHGHLDRVSCHASATRGSSRVARKSSGRRYCAGILCSSCACMQEQRICTVPDNLHREPLHMPLRCAELQGCPSVSTVCDCLLWCSAGLEATVVVESWCS